MTKTMMKRAALVLSIFALLFTAPVQAKPSAEVLEQIRKIDARVKMIQKRNRNKPPKAYMAFCRKHSRECRGGGASSVKYSKKLMATLYATNRSVNRKIRYRSERGDTWSLNTRVGDCEDYALTKRSQLIRKGIPASALRMAIVKTRGGIGHAVLVVKTSRGDLVLDNRRSSIRKRQSTGYRYVKMATSNPRRWVAMR